MTKYLETLQEQQVNKELEGIKRLIKAIIILSYKDLKSYLKNPYKYREIFSRKRESSRQIIEFWENDAFNLLSFLVGSYKAKVFLKKIEADISHLKRILHGE